jgi:hypothetical protein
MQYVFVTTIAMSGGGYEILVCPCNTDVLDALIDYHVDCRDTDVPLPRRLLLQRRVCHSFRYSVINVA